MTLLIPLFPSVPALSVVIYVVKNASRPKPVTFSPAQDGKRFAFQIGWIVTLRAGLCKCFLPCPQRKICGAIDKEKLLSAVGPDGLRDKLRRSLTAGLVDVLTEAVIGHIHFTQTCQDLRRAGVEMVGDELL